MQYRTILRFSLVAAFSAGIAFSAAAVKPAYFNLAEKGTDTLESRMQQYIAFANILRKNKTDTHSFAIRNMHTEYSFNDSVHVRPQDAYLLDIGITVYNETYGNIYGIDDAYLSPDLADEVMQIGFRQTTVGTGYQCYLNITLRHNATATLPQQDYTAEYMPYRTAAAPYNEGNVKLRSKEAQKSFLPMEA